MTSWADFDDRMDVTAVRVFGEDAEYRAGCADPPESIRAILSEDVQRIGEAGYVDTRTEIQVRQSDMPTPAKGDCLTINSVIWVVDDIEPAGLRWVLVVRKQ